MITTTKKEGKIYLQTPYNAEFVKRIKAAGGRWTMDCWVVSDRAEEIVEKIMMEIFGENGKTAVETVNVRVTVKPGYCLTGYQSGASLFGRPVAKAWGRDSGAKVCDGVCFEKGAPTSGGSVKNWKTLIDEGTVFLMYDVPRAIVEREIGTPSLEDVEVEIIKTGISREALEAEKSQLLARLAEIENELSRG